MTAVAGATTGSEARTPSQHARRARIVEAATELLEDREYERIQIREVAEAADVALATLYRYFPSKEQLYATVLLTWAESFDPGGGRSRSVPRTDQARLRAALRRAVRAYEHAAAQGTAETHFNLGNCYYAQRRRSEAGKQFLAAIGHAPEYAEAWNNLGIVRGELGDRHGAVEALQRALELVPHYADAHYNLAEALAVVGDLDGARRHWRAYLTFDPNSRWAEQVRRRLQANGG